jgi:3-methyladenine DNA glycosylase AlkD
MDRAAELIAELRRHARPGGVEGMARYGIVSSLPAMGVSVGDCRAVAKTAGRDQALAEKLWDSGWYEGRMLAVFVAEPKAVTPELMDSWAADFDNWAICDTACFDLFDKSPHAFDKIRQWAPREEEFVRRAAFALLASVALHEKKRSDADFLEFLPLIDAQAADGRNFVKKGVSWALRSMGQRAGLHQPCVALAGQLVASSDPVRRWIGKDTLRDLSRPLVKKRVGL